jgi:CRP/FNR family transcriptional regulator, anaerobic regulatory protein
LQRKASYGGDHASMVNPKEGAARQVPCERCPLRKVKIFRPFTPEELAFVSTLKTGELRVEAGSMLFLEGMSSAHLYTVLSGWAFRYKLLSDGRRQILRYCFPRRLPRAAGLRHE